MSNDNGRYIGWTQAQLRAERERLGRAHVTPEQGRQLVADIQALQPCCPRDTDGDGNCDLHSAPGRLRNAEIQRAHDAEWAIREARPTALPR